MFRLYWVYFKTNTANLLQYRLETAIWMIARVLEPTIYLVVWSTVSRARGGDVGGYSPADFAAYYIVLMLVDHLTLTWIMDSYDVVVRNGDLSSWLLQPVHPNHSSIAGYLSYKVLTLAVLVPAAFILGVLFRPALGVRLVNVLLFIPSIVLAFLLRFFVESCVATGAFWTTRIEAFSRMYFLIALFLSGTIAPLEVLPSWMRTLAWVLPFRLSVAFPVEVFLGRAPVAQLPMSFALQALWLGVAFGLYSFLWKRGIRRYSAVGG